MTDIVTSLRAHHGSAYMCQDCYGTTMDEAADEIERLRNIVATFADALRAINETIYATGAPVGSTNYFIIRRRAVDALKISGESVR